MEFGDGQASGANEPNMKSSEPDPETESPLRTSSTRIGGKNVSTTTATAIEMLETGIRDLQSQEAWKSYLAVQSRFHHYSFGNTLLITCQRPTATRVAGFHTWKDLGYSVRKGEKGIAILAPVTVRRTVENEDGEAEIRQQPVTFRVVYVFDVAQVDAGPAAKHLPTGVPGCERLTADAPAELLDRLHTVASELGYRVEITDRLEHPGSNGECDYSMQTIRIRTGLAGAQTVKTFAHELAHAILHADFNGTVRSRELAELEAESTAYVVCQAFGIDSSSYSLGYVTSWTGADAIKLIRASGERIQKAAHRVLAEPVAAAEDRAA